MDCLTLKDWKTQWFRYEGGKAWNDIKPGGSSRFDALSMQWNEESDAKWNRQDTFIEKEPQFGYKTMGFMGLGDRISLFHRRPVNMFVATNPDAAKQMALKFPSGPDNGRIRVIFEVALNPTFNKFTFKVGDSTTTDPHVAELLIWPLRLVPDPSVRPTVVTNPKMDKHMLIVVRMIPERNVDGNMLVEMEDTFKERSDQVVNDLIQVADLIPKNELDAWRQWF
eukprot:TRINITY_DN3576_c0_g1_i1.p1 TRINITY_DN3576_c0_g1~~TRINITY_DN3576_c0_g1_i1.p1  ORF type:complete len:224 (+),score=49.47 TRINITY_DN3576_c0_g1_i1:69-740(+)